MTLHKPSFVIAVDGPSGSGKGTLSQRLATFYDFALLDTGLLYRAVASKMQAQEEDFKNQDLAVKAAQTLTPQDFLNPKNREDATAVAASKIAVFQEVREVLNQYQKDFAEKPPMGKLGAVLDGRDIGTSICPQAPIKLFLVAKDKIRAQRRFEELQSRGMQVIYADVLNDICVRDERDKKRTASPLRPAKGAIIVDTSFLNSEDVFTKVCDIIESSPAFKAWRMA